MPHFFVTADFKRLTDANFVTADSAVVINPLECAVTGCAESC
jgi:hypothetical protein